MRVWVWMYIHACVHACVCMKPQAFEYAQFHIMCGEIILIEESVFFKQFFNKPLSLLPV